MIKRNKVYIIAEIGINHNGNLNLAIKSIKAAAKGMVKSGKIMDVKTVIGIMWYHEFINGIK